MLHRGQVPNAELICFTVYFIHWVSVGTFHGGKYLHDIIRRQSSFHTSQKVLCRVSVGNRHRYIKPICTHCQILFKNTGSPCFLQHNHVKSWNIIIWSYLAGPLSGGLQEFRINRNLIEYPVIQWTVYSIFNYSLQ